MDMENRYDKVMSKDGHMLASEQDMVDDKVDKHPAWMRNTNKYINICLFGVQRHVNTNRSFCDGQPRKGKLDQAALIHIRNQRNITVQ